MKLREKPNLKMTRVRLLTCTENTIGDTIFTMLDSKNSYDRWQFLFNVALFTIFIVILTTIQNKICSVLKSNLFL